ncbi:Lrp/AsnC family transcriptional regulator [Actinoalloteichus sp. AHMU CJ021]|uniref:Lrp/AsnC family transcriptional regulator, leucine-responsive regulatory protein n=1 Tax=Actinoalloteichus caeruleus DSM 43889 TaxID=1120930 RepID=A0ABT1JMG9_ACTCY|nr:Lrp/AsnC family transcriptional regulator [Actinoalloteichus caeruleus]AUS79100.1 Lrp/AsnC family transcriptional regulator [Actinoalloteichus sp. AHMU CJ021]MCP2333344.1 Lrp/AsnC family transcriptional regulator, leucine-responsive regulatory protein [Actinoalloteichus caeruleus DSM 43889]
MDAVDRRIIAALRISGRATYADLGRQVGLSASAVHERVGKLEAAGVITGYHAVVDPSTVGLGVTALVGIHPTNEGDDDRIAEALAELPEVESCYAVAGEEAFVVKVRVAAMDELEKSLGRLRRIEGVARTRTTIVLSTRFEGRPNTPSELGPVEA